MQIHAMSYEKQREKRVADPSGRMSSLRHSREVSALLQRRRSGVDEPTTCTDPDRSSYSASSMLPAVFTPAASNKSTVEAANMPESDDKEGIELGGLIRLMPRPLITLAPPDAGGSVATGGGVAAAGTVSCDAPINMNKVISGKFKYGKSLNDYYPDLVGTKTWGSKDTAGPFDNGFRAGSSVQLYGEFLSPCVDQGNNLAIEQQVTIKRMRGDGKKIMEGGKPLEGQTINDIKRSGRDASKAPFRQTVSFAVTFADPISGAPYSMFKSYDFEADLTSSLVGSAGKASVNWGVTVQSAAGKITKNTVR